MVPISIMFRCGFRVPRGYGAFRAIVFRASCSLLFITVDVLSPNIISNFDGKILPGVRVGLSSGAFSELLLHLGLIFCFVLCLLQLLICPRMTIVDQLSLLQVCVFLFGLVFRPILLLCDLQLKPVLV